MKLLIKATCVVLTLILSQACKKSNLNPGGSGSPAGAYFFSNTEWTGVAATYGQTYQQPCYLHFNGDTTVSVYALFDWVIGNDLLAIDSVIGNITNIDTVTDGVTTISVNFPYTNDQQQYIISGKNSLKGGSLPTTKASYSTVYTNTLQLCPSTIPSVAGTDWSTNKITVAGPTAGGYEFPDLSNFSFLAGNEMTYIRGGKIITYTPPTQDKVDQQGYFQVGPKIYLAGYNDAANVFIRYFGVLSADGKTIWADTRARQAARLPYYTQTIYWYGDPGVTPNIHMQ